MLHKNRVFERLLAWHQAGETMVLATVVETVGSTYSKPGDFIVINASGEYQGLISGGCVEGDLAERARQAIEKGLSVIVDYDLGGEADAVWGLGAGCDGQLNILLTPLLNADDYAPLLAVADAYQAGLSAVLALSVDGSAMMSSASAEGHFVHAGVDEAWRTTLEQQLGEQWLARASSMQQIAMADRSAFVVYLNPAPRILICGAAPDVDPLCSLMLELGWHIMVCDYRPGYIERLSAEIRHARFSAALVRPEHLAREVPLTLYGAAVVMSHHLENDQAYLAALATSTHWRYVGLLGPEKRRDRILDALGCASDHLETVLEGPAGLDIGGREPASIALSIAAGVHARLARTGVL